MTIIEIAGLAGGLLTLFAFGTYLPSILRGTVKPQRATWWIWTLNSLLLLTSYKAEGATDTAWLAIAYTIGCVIVALLTIRYGVGGWSTLDRFCFGGTIVAAALWIVIGPLATFVSTLIIDLLGVLPTIYESYRHPEEEDTLSWVLWFFGGFVSLLAIQDLFVTKWSLEVITILAYPLQITVTAGIIVWFLIRPRVQKTLNNEK